MDSICAPQIESIEEGRGRRLMLVDCDRALTCREFIMGLNRSAHLRTTLTRALSGMPFAAFRWEMPAVSEQNADRPWECVVVERAGLRRRADPIPFQHRFTPEPVTAFPSLGGDAMLIVPCPRTPSTAASPSFEPTARDRIGHTKSHALDCYAHLAAFVRNAPPDQIDAVWQRVGAEAIRRWRRGPVWINTAGAGVAWLHVRLDRHPKYYSYLAYRRSPTNR